MSCGKLDHCCIFRGKICQYLRETVGEKFKFRCSLLEQKGTWSEVAASPEYINIVKPLYVNAGISDIDCWSFPKAGKKCNTCGQVGE